MASPAREGYHTHEEESRLITLVVEGEVDHGNVRSFQEDLDRVLGDGSGAVLLDFSSTSFIDGACLGSLFLVLRRLTAGGRLALVGVSDEIQRLFRIAGLTAMPRLELYATRGEALVSMLSYENGRADAGSGRGCAGRTRTAAEAFVRRSGLALLPRTYAPALFGMATMSDRIHD